MLSLVVSSNIIYLLCNMTIFLLFLVLGCVSYVVNTLVERRSTKIVPFFIKP